MNVVSIPAGFSDALRRICRDDSQQNTMFQSLLGFLMRCDVLSGEILQSRSMFQSLLGFLMRCDIKYGFT